MATQVTVQYVHKIAGKLAKIEGPYTIADSALSDSKALGKALRKAKIMMSGARVQSFRVEGDKVHVFPVMPGLSTYWHCITLTVESSLAEERARYARQGARMVPCTRCDRSDAMLPGDRMCASCIAEMHACEDF